MLASALGLAGLVPSAVQASKFPNLTVLDAEQARKLLTVARTLFPHDFLDDDYYINVVTAIDAKAAADPATSEILLASIADLPSGFIVMYESDREDYLRSIEGSPFFTLAYDETLSGLYGNSEVARRLGYEGSSIEFGGYINHGFDDIDWLPVE